MSNGAEWRHAQLAIAIGSTQNVTAFVLPAAVVTTFLALPCVPPMSADTMAPSCAGLTSVMSPAAVQTLEIITSPSLSRSVGSMA